MANNKHAVVRIDKLGGTLDGACLLYTSFCPNQAEPDER